MKPSNEELETELRKTKDELGKTQQLLKMALERILKLEEQINKNSKNSSTRQS